MMDYIFRRLALDHLPYDQRPTSASSPPPSAPPSSPARTRPCSGSRWTRWKLAQSAAVENNRELTRTSGARAQAARGSRRLGSTGHRGGSGRPGDRARRAAGTARPSGPHSTAELIEFQQGRTADAPLCLTCGTKMRPAGSCYVCEGCGSTSGCS